MTEQPTEQWVQKFFRVVTVAPAGGGGPASALRIAAERQIAERRQRPDGDTGALEEGAAIHLAPRPIG